MTKLAEKMTERLSALPDSEQDVLASAILDLLDGSTAEEEAEWDDLTQSKESLSWLQAQSQKIRAGSEETYDFDPSNMPK